MLKLKDFAKINVNGGEVVSVTNIDDHFRDMRKIGIKEVEVDFNEMYMIVSFILAQLSKQVREESDVEYKEEKEYRDLVRGNIVELIKTYEIDQFMGIKLHLNESA